MDSYDLRMFLNQLSDGFKKNWKIVDTNGIELCGIELTELGEKDKVITLHFDDY